MKLFTEEWEKAQLWQVRESGLGATAHVPGMPPAHPGWEDAAVAPANVGAYLRDFLSLLDDYRIRLRAVRPLRPGVHSLSDRFRSHDPTGQFASGDAFLQEAARLVVRYGGSLSGEDGDGQARATLLPIMYGDDLVRAFGAFKRIWDPQNRMNPHRVVEPAEPDENLRIGPDVRAAAAGHSLQVPGRRLLVRQCCVPLRGRRQMPRRRRGDHVPQLHGDAGGGGLHPRPVAPVVRDAAGDVVAEGWRDDHIKDALELCLACKGCKHECPVNVDMATYKAEFLSHYYQGGFVPAPAYAMGLIYWWARLAAPIAPVVNFLMQTRPVLDAHQGAGRRRPAAPDASLRIADVPAVVPRPAWALCPLTPCAPARGGRLRVPATGHAFRARYLHHAVESARLATGSASTFTPKPSLSATNRVLLWPDTFSNYPHGRNRARAAGGGA